MRLMFGPLEPDKPPHLQEGLQQADNVFPAPNGYRPIKAFSAITDAMPEDFQGGATFVASDGTVNLLAGTTTDLYRYNSSLEWASIESGLTAGRWYFTQYGDVAIATHGGAPLAVDLQAGTADVLSGSPPDAALCMTVREFVVLGQADGEENKVAWSGFGNETQWVNGTNQADEQPMLTGGAITGMAGGEYGLIFQRSQITRMTYVGVPGPIFQFDVISPNIGCLAAGSVAQAGRLTFFLSDRGFYVTDGNDVKPIGAERINRTFLESYSPQDIELMYATVDPQQSIVLWIMPGKAWGYNWELDRWFTSEQAIKAAFQGFTAGVTLEELDALFANNIDTMGVSLDDARFKGGAPLLLIVNSSDEVGTLTGENLEATFEQPYLEPIDGRAARISRVRPITDAIDGITLNCVAKQRLGNTPTIETFAELEASGDIPIRISGRHIKFTTLVAAGTDWSYIQGLELTRLAAGGVR